MSLRDRLIDPRSPDRRPRRAAYALPTLFTAGNVFLGFYALLETFQGAMAMLQSAAGRAPPFSNRRAVDRRGRVSGRAGWTHRAHDQHRQRFRPGDGFARRLHHVRHRAGGAGVRLGHSVRRAPHRHDHTGVSLRRAGYFFSFVFLLCGAARLARFNITKNPIPKNPGRPDRKYFVGLPIPAAAAAVASVVYAAGSEPLHWWVFSASWLALLALLSFLMVSTWRYPSFKDFNLLRPRSPLSVVV